MSSSQKARLLYKVNKLGPRNTKKVLELTKDFTKLLKRMEKEGKTTWMMNAIGFAKARLNRAGFSDQTIEKKYSISLKTLLAKEEKKTAKAPKAVKKTSTEDTETKTPAAKKAPTTAKKAPAKKKTEAKAE